jgi:glycosyltransferase involved in cell wall biosynthesis
MNSLSGGAPKPLTIIIPAWRGETTIERSLDALLRQSLSDPTARGAISIFVAVNDGRSETLERALAYNERMQKLGYSYSVVNTPPSRSAAFNQVEAGLVEEARLYLDQDAALSIGALEALTRLLSATAIAQFVSFKPKFARSRSFWVRSFLRGWSYIPYVRRSPATAGVYGVSGLGRRRWKDFPVIASDDKFVRLMFAPAERNLIASECYEVLPPPDLKSLVRYRLRYLEGNTELREFLRGNDMWSDVGRFSCGSLALVNPLKWFDICVVGIISSVVMVMHILKNLRRR